uniref:Cytochrome P450 n=1 Tax=Mycena chlorophos TaxID=658473 RepID=A0ABQ0L8U9_MYCCL|nr:cytochrome P450 [Mycena chlorophos]
MPQPSNLEFAASLAAAAAAVAVFIKLIRRRKSGCPPPGPAGFPIVGNLFDLPVNEPWRIYQAWSAQYGSDVVHMRVFGTNMLVINSAKAASELLGRRSAKYSDRPRMPMIQDVIGLSWHFAFMPYGDRWRQHRRLFVQHAHAFDNQNQTKWTKIFLQNLLLTPDDFVEHIQHIASGASLEATFGLQVQPSGQPDPFIGAAKVVVQSIVEAGIFGTYLVDFLPWLRRLQFFSFKKQATTWRAASDVAAHVPWDLTKKAMESEDFLPSAASVVLSDHEANKTVSRQAMAAMFANGSAATVSAIATFILAMVLYPEIQQAAQAEIDRVVQERLPDLTDEHNLPYLTAIIREIGRWNPVVPFAFPHALSADDSYNGYYLEAGTVVIPNSWAILHDPTVYPDPEKFDPSRFLTSDGRINTLVKDPEAVWGYGRRVCPGRKIATSEMFLVFAGILKVFDIRPAVSEKGDTLLPPGEYEGGLLRYPKPFKCSIRPRSTNAAALLQ